MRFISRFIVFGAILTQIVASALGLLVLGMAGVLGQAAVISASDAMLLFILMALNLLATLVLLVKLRRSSTEKKRLRSQVRTHVQA